MSNVSCNDPEGALHHLLDQVITETRETCELTGCSTLSEQVLHALASTPRHCFVPMEQQEWAYADMPLPIGRGQTISQPFIVALMTELLNLKPDAVVLEIGTGTGYQTAILARLARKVYSVERIPELATTAAHRLDKLGCTNIAIRVDDGQRGWEDYAPFDGIIVTAAATAVPPALIQQLKPGGQLVIPVGFPHQTQDLRLIDKDDQGMVHSRSVLPVVFVPMIHDPE